MSLSRIFDIAATALSAQSVRLNTVASNLANADAVSGTPEGAYRAREPVFASLVRASTPVDPSAVGVQVLGIVEDSTPGRMEHRPDHPQADEAGNVYLSNVNLMEEMANMISASRAYQNNVEVIKTSKELLLRTLELGG